MTRTKKYLIEFILFSTYALYAMSWKAGDFLIASYGFDDSQRALMTNAISFAIIFACLITGYLNARFSNKNIFSLASVLIICGILLPFTHEPGLIFVIRFILGFGGALILIITNSIVAEIFTRKELTIVVGINSVSFNFGLAIVLALALPIESAANTTIFLISGCSIIVLLCWLVIKRYITKNTFSSSPPSHHGESYGILDGMKDRFNWIFTLSYSGLLSFYVVAFTFMQPDDVKYIIFSGIFGALTGAFMSKIIKNQLVFIRICSLIQLISAIIFMMNYDTDFAKLMGAILGIFIFLPMPSFATLAYLRPNVTSGKVAVTFSLFWAVSYFISIIVLQIFAYLMDAYTSNFASFVFILLVDTSFFIGTTFFIRPIAK